MLDIHLHLMANPGASLSATSSVVASFPHALAQCRKFLTAHLPHAGDRRRRRRRPRRPGELGEHPEPDAAAIAPPAAADVYGLEVLAEDVEDHPENQTRFVAVARVGDPRRRPATTARASSASRGPTIPAVCTAILGQFAARDINLTKLESRPTKQGLGDYCFVIDLDGHIGDEIVADCLRDLHASLVRVKFLGSYPAAGHQARADRREAERGLAARPTSGSGDLRAPDREPWVRGSLGRVPCRVRRDGRADECAALEKPWDSGSRGFESHSLRKVVT